jgi:hypothetical protein
LVTKYEIAEKDGLVGASIPLGKCRVRPSYLRFLELRDSARIDKRMTWAKFQEKYPEKVKEWDGK